MKSPGLATLATFVMLTTGLCSRTVLAAEPPLKVKINPLSVVSGRTGGPMVLDVTMDWAGRGLLQGNLEVVAQNGMEEIWRYQSEDLALVNGLRSFRMLMPAVNARMYGRGEITLELAFLTRGQRWRLPPQSLSVPGSDRRQFNICVSDGTGGHAGTQMDDLVRSLRPERLLGAADGTGVGLVTTAMRMKPEDFPINPLAYCCHDVVVVESEGLKLLREGQLKALAAWVESGGSVCVLAGTGLEMYHLDFLNRLSGSLLPLYALGPSGTAESVAGDASAVLAGFHCGLGRAVIRSGRPGTLDPEGKDWRLSACFLWKMRRSLERRVLAATGAASRTQNRPLLEIPREEEFDSRRMMADGEVANGLMRLLLPRNARPVGLWIIIGILSAFVLVIGPVDYFLLGAFRARKYTWVAFPAVSLGFALVMVWVTESTLGSADNRSAVVFVDVGPAGHVFRTNRYEMIFSARPGDAVTQLHNACFIPVGAQESFGQYQYYAAGRGLAESGPVRYSGRIPTRYQVTQEIRKWTPQFNRTLTLDDPGVKPGIEWDAVTLKDLRTAQPRETQMKTLAGDKPFPGDLFFLYQGKMTVLARTLLSTGVQSQVTGVQGQLQTRDGRLVVEQSPAEVSMTPGLSVLDQFVVSVSQPTPRGPFRALSQMSPTWRGDFDDLAVVDPEDPDQLLLVAEIKVGKDYYVFRRLYCGEQ